MRGITKINLNNFFHMEMELMPRKNWLPGLIPKIYLVTGMPQSYKFMKTTIIIAL